MIKEYDMHGIRVHFDSQLPGLQPLLLRDGAEAKTKSRLRCCSAMVPKQKQNECWDAAPRWCRNKNK